MTGEGDFLPISTPDSPVEETSGYVVDKEGRVFSFWFGWDPNRQAPALVEWEPVEPEPDWTEEREYRDALHKLGLLAA